MVHSACSIYKSSLECIGIYVVELISKCHFLDKKKYWQTKGETFCLPFMTNMPSVSHLFLYFGSLHYKQYGPRSD